MDGGVSVVMRVRCVALALLMAVVTPGHAKPSRDDWRQIITQHDRARIKNWRVTWVDALKEAQAHGFTAAIAADGVLLQPDSALDHPAPPDGLYQCRTLKLGTQPSPDATPSPHAFATFPAGRCRIADHMLARLDGLQRPSGRLYPYDDSRLLFLGGMALGDEAGPSRYQRDPQRALVGFVERIGPQRWRLVLPQPAWESRIDVIELVPANG